MNGAYEQGRAEGDVNGTRERLEWQSRNVSDAAREQLEADSAYFLHQSMSTPCLHVVEKMEGIYFTDMDGRTYMDFHGNSVHQVGYKNPYVIEAVKRQLDELPFTPRRFTSRVAIELARTLSELAPGDLNRVLFAPGGTSAVGIALKLVRKATGRYKTISMWDSFHGASLDAISVGGEGVFRKDIGPLLPGAEHIMPFDSYRSIFGEGAEAGAKNLDYLEYVLQRESDVGAVLMEPIRSTDVHVPPHSYYRRLRELCDRYGALLVFDEIPTALGRTGTMFVHEHYGIVPDIVVIGKGLGGGVVPMAAVIAREGLHVAQDVSLGHYTHEKSALGCAAGLATIQYIQEHGLLAHAAEMGRRIQDRLQSMKQTYACVGDVRGIGMLAAIELVRDRETKERAIEETEKVMYRCLDRGVSFKVASGNVIALYPPHMATQEQIDLALDRLD